MYIHRARTGTRDMGEQLCVEHLDDYVSLVDSQRFIELS